MPLPSSGTPVTPRQNVPPSPCGAISRRCDSQRVHGLWKVVDKWRSLAAKDFSKPRNPASGSNSCLQSSGCGGSTPRFAGTMPREKQGIRGFTGSMRTPRENRGAIGAQLDSAVMEGQHRVENVPVQGELGMLQDFARQMHARQLELFEAHQRSVERSLAAEFARLTGNVEDLFGKHHIWSLDQFSRLRAMMESAVASSARNAVTAHRPSTRSKCSGEWSDNPASQTQSISHYSHVLDSQVASDDSVNASSDAVGTRFIPRTSQESEQDAAVNVFIPMPLREKNQNTKSFVQPSVAGSHSGWLISSSVSLFHSLCARLGCDLSVHRQTPQNSIAKLVSSHSFQLASATLISLNAIWIGFHLDQSMKDALNMPPRDEPEWFGAVHFAFTSVFCIEVMIRLFGLRASFFLRADWMWNVFDLALAFGCLLELMHAGIAMKHMRIFRVFWLARGVRIIRKLRFFSELRQMIGSLLSSLRLLVGAALIMSFIIYVFSIVIMQVTIGALQNAENVTPEDIMNIEQRYGSVAEAMYTMLLAISFGKEWDELVTPLAQLSWVFKPTFACYVVLMVFGMTNVVAGVFAERVREIKGNDRDLAVQVENERTEYFEMELRDLLEEAGLNGNSKTSISWDRFQATLAKDDVRMYLQSQNIDVSDALRLFRLLDSSGKNEISIDDFINGCQRIKGHAKMMDLALVYEQGRRIQRKMQEFRDQEKANCRAVHNAMSKVVCESRELRADFLDFKNSSETQ